MKKIIALFFFLSGFSLVAQQTDSLKPLTFSASLYGNLSIYRDTFYNDAFKPRVKPGGEFNITYKWNKHWGLAASLGYLSTGFTAEKHAPHVVYRVNQQYRLFYLNPSLLYARSKWFITAGFNIPLYAKSRYTYNIFQNGEQVYENSSEGGLLKEDYASLGLTATFNYQILPEISVFTRLLSHSTRFNQIILGIQYNFYSK